MKLKWERHKTVDGFTDHVYGEHMIAAGFGEPGEWDLFFCGKYVATFKGLAEAKQAAEEKVSNG